MYNARVLEINSTLHWNFYGVDSLRSNYLLILCVRVLINMLCINGNYTYHSNLDASLNAEMYN